MIEDNRRGRCFELNGQAITGALHGIDRESARLVHGYPILQGGEFIGRRYSHAWIEYDAGIPMIYDAVSQQHLPQAIYFAAGEIDPELSVKYTIAEALDFMENHGTFGPWHDEPDAGAWLIPIQAEMKAREDK